MKPFVMVKGRTGVSEKEVASAQLGSGGVLSF